MVSSDRLRILVLDDDVRFLESFEDLLLEEGHCVFPATRASDAVDLVRVVPLDLSFLDYELPDLDGLEAYARIHLHRPELPAIFVSGNPSAALERMVLDVGAFALLRKPFNAVQVRVAIRGAMRKQN